MSSTLGAMRASIPFLRWLRTSRFSARQGDPGSSRFYLSLEDDLMRIFGSERMDGMLQRLGLQEGEAIIHPWINKALEKAQQKVEARNFDARKNLLKFDNVMNDQRKVIFEQRIEIMRGDDVSAPIDDMRHQVIEETVATFIPPDAYAEQWNTSGLREKLRELVAIDFPASTAVTLGQYLDVPASRIVYQVTVAGTTAAAAPTPPGVGNTVASGTATVRQMTNG